MSNQPIEAIELIQEPRPRRAKKFLRPLAACALSLATVSGGLVGEGNSDRKEPATVAVASPAASEKQRLSGRDELRAIREASQKTEERRQRLERFYNFIAWNTHVWENRPRIIYDSKRWYDLHQCEQGDSWYADGYNSADPGHQRFQGGLGMSTVAWDMAVEDAAQRGVTLPDSALDATIDEQMQGAQVFWEDEGWGWSCRV